VEHLHGSYFLSSIRCDCAFLLLLRPVLQLRLCSNATDDHLLPWCLGKVIDWLTRNKHLEAIILGTGQGLAEGYYVGQNRQITKDCRISKDATHRQGWGPGHIHPIHVDAGLYWKDHLAPMQHSYRISIRSFERYKFLEILKSGYSCYFEMVQSYGSVSRRRSDVGV